MLLRPPVLDRIVAGEIDLAFRRWTRPTVKTGGTLRTQLGLLEIVKVTPVEIEDITEEDARRAGLELGELIEFLNRKTEGEVHLVELGSVVPDPRVALREDDDLSEGDVDEIRSRLDRLDRASRRGALDEAVPQIACGEPACPGPGPGRWSGSREGRVQERRPQAQASRPDYQSFPRV